MRTGRLAREWARGQVTKPDKDFTRLCLQFVRMAYGLPAVYPDAGTAWDRAKHRHPVQSGRELTIPGDVPVFWELPSRADHVAYSVGGGYCLSNDVRRPGRIDLVRIDSITASWGGTLLGWTEDLNGVRVWERRPVENNVTRANAHLRIARRELRLAMVDLDSADPNRARVHQLHDELGRLAGRLSAKMERMPKR